MNKCALLACFTPIRDHLIDVPLPLSPARLQSINRKVRRRRRRADSLYVIVTLYSVSDEKNKTIEKGGPTNSSVCALLACVTLINVLLLDAPPPLGPARLQFNRTSRKGRKYRRFYIALGV